MAKREGASVPTGAGSIIKRIAFFFLKAVYIVPFFLIGLWLISVVYFPGFDLNASISVLEEVGGENAAGKTAARKNGAVPLDHFHITDRYVERLDEKQQVCDSCHGVYAHGRDKKVRALLNLHTGYMACTVCHVRKEGGEGQGGAALGTEIAGFTWVDRDTGEFKSSVTGEYGKYAEMIVPVTGAGQGVRRIYMPMADLEAQRFLDNRPEWSEKELDEARINLHARISKEAVTCADCHQKDGYLGFPALGYSRQRVDNLTSSEVVGMIENYTTFYLPSVVDFRGE